MKCQDPNCHHFPSGDANIIYAQGTKFKKKHNYSAHKRQQLFHMPPNYRRHLESWDCRHPQPHSCLCQKSGHAVGSLFQGNRQGDAGGAGMHSAVWDYLPYKSESAAKSQEKGREDQRETKSDVRMVLRGLRTER